MYVALLVVSFLILLLNVLYGMWRGTGRSILRLLTLALAAVGAFVLAKELSATLADVIAPKLRDMMSSNSFLTGFVKSNPEMPALFGALAEMMVAPVLFFLCYFILKPFSMIIYFILRTVFRVKKGRKPLSKLGGAVVGFVIGVIGLIALAVPLIGYADLAVRSVEELDRGNEESILGEAAVYYDDYVKPIAQTPVMKIAYDLVGDRLFDNLTVTEWNGEQTQLEKEWFAILGVIREAKEFSKTPMAEYSEKETQTLRAFVESVASSRILTYLGGNTISGMSQAWLNGEGYFGIDSLTLGDANAQLILNGLLRVFAGTDPVVIVSDLHFLVDLFDLLVQYRMFSLLREDASTEAFIERMVTSGFLEAAYTQVRSNSRMDPLFKAMHDVGMNVLVSTLGLPAEYRENYGQLMDDMTHALQGCVGADGAIDVGQLHASLNQAFAENGVEISSAAAEVIASGLSGEFTAEELLGGLDAEEITNRLIERFEGAESLESVLPEGTLPEGILPDGVLPDGVLPEGVLPEGAV